MSYNIDQFSKITGINKLLLRTWENRYEFLKAPRSKTKIRMYSDELLIKALNTKILINNGYKISYISTQNDVSIKKMVEKIKNEANIDEKEPIYINKLIESGIKYNEKLFNETYDDGVGSLGIINFYQKVILPTFAKIGLFWLTNRMNPGQEHFLSELFKQKIIATIDREEIAQKKTKTWLLFLPPEEYHEIGLIFSKLLLLRHGFKVIYLGANVPLYCVSEITKKKTIDNILYFSISNLSKKNLKSTVDYLNNDCKQIPQKIVTNLNNSQIEHKNVKIINDLQSFLDIIKSK